MCRGGGGNKIRLCTKEKKVQSAFHFFFPPKVSFENILSRSASNFFSLTFLIPATPRTRELVAS